MLPFTNILTFQSTNAQFPGPLFCFSPAAAGITCRTAAGGLVTNHPPELIWIGEVLPVQTRSFHVR
jgi:hypothetical protein